LAALPPYRAVLLAFDNTVGEVLGSPPASKTVAVAKPLSEAIRMLDDELLRLGDAYPPFAVDVKNLVAATSAFKRDLDSIGAVAGLARRARSLRCGVANGEVAILADRRKPTRYDRVDAGGGREVGGVGRGEGVALFIVGAAPRSIERTRC
jgi:hypothetical protein